MSDVIIPYRFVVKRDTAANWTANNPILKSGEWGLETGTRKMKVGDGSTAWNSLLYSVPGKFDLTGIADGYTMVWSASLGKFVPGVVGGSGYVDPSTNLINPLYDFIAKPPTSGAVSAGADYPWLAEFSATSGTTITSIDGGATAPGVWRLDTGTASNGRTNIRLGDVSCITTGGGRIILPFRFRIPTLSDGTNRFEIEVGFRDAWSAARNNAAYIRYSDNANSGKFELYTTVGGADTITAGTTTVVANTWYSGYFDIAANGSQIDVYINGALEFSGTTGLPTGAMAVGAGIYKSVGSGAGSNRYLSLDYLGPPQQTFTTAR